MKRIEAVITPWTLDAFKEIAPRLGISEFDIVQIYRSGGAPAGGRQHLYRSCEFTADLSRLRLEFLLFDDKVQSLCTSFVSWCIQKALLYSSWTNAFEPLHRQTELISEPCNERRTRRRSGTQSPEAIVEYLFSTAARRNI
jgi:nitrogen regulatory protein PII